MLYHGGRRVFDIGRMRYFWTWWKASTSWCASSTSLRLALNRQVNASGNVIRSEILGAVKMKCYLSGMPELRLGLNDKVMFESTGRSMLLASCLPADSLPADLHQRPGVNRSKWRT